MSFNDKARPDGIPYYLDFGIVFGLGTYAASPPEWRSFPRELVQVLQGKDREQRLVAFRYLNILAQMVRRSALEEGRQDVPGQFRLVLTPHGASIKAGLQAGLEDPVHEVGLLAATTLLVLEPEHSGALAVANKCLNSTDPILHARYCELAGQLRLHQGAIIARLCDLLRAKEGEVRRAAARAVMEIGPPAKAAVPGLIDLLRSKEAVGEVKPYWAICSARTCNFGVFALSQIGPDASPAVPALIKLLEEAKGQERADIIYCLGQIGPAAREAGPSLRQLLKILPADLRPKYAFPIPLFPVSLPETRLTVAAALLRIFPGDGQAIATVKNALTSSNLELRSQVLKTCWIMAVKDEALIAEFIAALQYIDDDVRERAACVVAGYGPAAADAVPALEKILMTEEHSFAPCRAAAYCLTKIGKAGLPALIKAATKAESMGRPEAIIALASFREDARQVVPVLTRALFGPKARAAIIALGKLGTEAPQATSSLFLFWLLARLAGDSETALLADWALLQTRILPAEK